MMPHIRYAHTNNGASIAYWVEGGGPPLVHLPWYPYSHLELECHISPWAAWLDRLVIDWQVVRYDSRGFGLSAVNMPDFSLEELVEDLEVIVDHLGLAQFALFGPVTSGQVAAAYAARHPGRVSMLFTWCAPSRATDSTQHRFAKALAEMAGGDWNLHTELFTKGAWGSVEEALVAQWVLLMRQSVTQDTWRSAIRRFYEIDITDMLPQVLCPALIIHRRGVPWPGVESARSFAAPLPRGELLLLEGSLPAPCFEDSETVALAMRRFREAVQQEASPDGRKSGQLATVVFTDIKDSTALTERLGDERAQQVLRKHNAIVRELLKSQGGDEIKHTGDGIMASFGSVARPLDCAIEIQRAVADHNAKRHEQAFSVRIGLNAGEPVQDENDLFGQAVQLAARICAHAEPGQILVSDTVKGLARGKGFSFIDQGEAMLNGLTYPVHLWELPWRDKINEA